MCQLDMEKSFFFRKRYDYAGGIQNKCPYLFSYPPETLPKVALKP